MSGYTVEQVHKILVGYVTEAGESLWEELESVFEGRQEHYLDFLVNNGYITKQQKENWLEHWYDACGEYDNIEAMTYMSKEDFPYDLMEEHGVIDESKNFELDYEKAKQLGLINVPLYIEYTDVSEFNEIYWSKALYIIADYLYNSLEIYGETLDDMDKTVKYYLGE